MSDGTPKDPAGGRMPWEPQTPEGGPPEPAAKPPESGWTPPSPTEPTTAWAPPQTEQPPAGQPPAPPPPWQPPAAGQAGLISSAPVGWSPPPAAGAEVAPGLAFADTTSRVVAYIVDGIILSIVGGILGSVLSPTTPGTVTNFDELMASTDPIGTILIVLIDFAYFIVAWTGGRRATIGQRLFNIQVGNAFDGRALTLEQATRRTLALGGWISLLSIVPGIFLLSGLIGLLWNIVLLITTATSPTKQGLHDRFANTALVRPAGVGTSGLATGCLVIIVVLLLLSVISFVALIFLGGQVSSILSEIGESI